MTELDQRFSHQHLLSMEGSRREFMPPETLLPEFLTSADLTMVDLGCGAGYFTVPAAKLLSAGRVYAIDQQQDMVDATIKRAQAESLDNVHGIVAFATDLPLEDASVDAVLMSMMFHDVPEKDDTLAEAKRVLKSEGSLYFVEWDRVEQRVSGPPLHIRIRPNELVDILQSAGFTVLAWRYSDVQPAVYFVHARAPKR